MGRVPSYGHSRLRFNVIDALGVGQRLRIVTPGGTFEVTAATSTACSPTFGPAEAIDWAWSMLYPVMPSRAEPFRLQTGVPESSGLAGPETPGFRWVTTRPLGVPQTGVYETAREPQVAVGAPSRTRFHEPSSASGGVYWPSRHRDVPAIRETLADRLRRRASERLPQMLGVSWLGTREP